jgi:hypothetical protein
MNNHDFWTDYAEAMELSIEGNRLIAQEITQWVRGLGRGIVRSLNALLPVSPPGYTRGGSKNHDRDRRVSATGRSLAAMAETRR